MKVFVINKERRTQPGRSHEQPRERRNAPVATTRYLLIVNEPELEKIIRGEFSEPPNAIHPHESGDDYLFYCIASDGFNEERFIRDLFGKITKGGRLQAAGGANPLEIHFYKNEQHNMKAHCYKLVNDKIERTHL